MFFYEKTTTKFATLWLFLLYQVDYNILFLNRKVNIDDFLQEEEKEYNISC